MATMASYCCGGRFLAAVAKAEPTGKAALIDDSKEFKLPMTLRHGS